MRTLILTIALLLAAPIHAEVPAEAASRLLRDALARDHGPGMMAAVARGSCLVWSDAAGHADLEQQVPLTTDTRMRIGSVSKTLTAALALRLVQDGQMDPDADIRDYVPAFPDKGHPITPGQLAAHVSGIRHYDFTNLMEANNVRYYERLEDALVVFAGDDLLATPGESFEYSSFGYNLLGVAAANAAGMSFGEALAARVTMPLGLEDTLIDHPLMLIPSRTRFYTVVDGGGAINTIWRDSSDYYPSGGILSTAEDLVKFARAVFAGDFLDAERRQLAQTRAATNDGAEVAYSFGWEVRAVNGQRRYEHGGETNGAYARVIYLPEHDLAVAGITNYNFWGETLGEAAFFEFIVDTLPELLAGAECARP
ncbi:MAG: beta-lactamase family protein [Chromatiales bacterium]|nr:beta-lactamase family protein [Chromatiales bacterium]MDH4030362.1 beta-lactamase family protein [Chromatiales bacterium]